MKEIKISIKWMKKLFTCNTDFILNCCKGKCCQGSNKILISLLPEEQIYFNNYNIADGKLLPDERGLCPFKNNNGLCQLHNKNYKPFGCIASPFTLNNNNTLIIRYRYSRMPCFGKGQPAYITFKKSLILLFDNEYKNLIKKIKGYNYDFYINMEDKIYNNLKFLDNLKKE